ncbi:MAG: hypothetical protein JWQ19_1248 [Subtercola sp.]|nr:hypothetical protein [Subtercola sp.]
MTTTLSESGVLDLFDRLIEEGVEIRPLVGQVAAFVQGRLGVVLSDGTAVSGDALGHVSDQGMPPDALVRQSGRRDIVWVDRDSGPLEESDFLLRRLAVAVQVLDRREDLHTRVASPVELLLQSRISQPMLVETLRRLRLRATDRIAVYVAEGSDRAWEEFRREHIPFGLVAAADYAGRHVALLRSGSEIDDDSVTPPAGLRVALSTDRLAREGNRAFREAVAALRLARPLAIHGRPRGLLVRCSELGALHALSELSRSDIDGIADVAVLETLARRHGPIVLEALEAYASTQSQREAAALLHVHHNSIAHWVRRAEDALHCRLTAPYQRTRLLIALMLLRMRDSAHPGRPAGPTADVRL